MAMKERPILMSAPMVRALLAGTKTQTRRVIKARVEHWEDIGLYIVENPCPYGEPGDRLWVRETWQHKEPDASPPGKYWYRADPGVEDCVARSVPGWKWRPSIFMPRAASRIVLELTAVHVERLQDINAPDAMAEGIEVRPDGWYTPEPGSSFQYLRAVDTYANVWTRINGAGSWNANPWVWALSFKRLG